MKFVVPIVAAGLFLALLGVIVIAVNLAEEKQEPVAADVPAVMPEKPEPEPAIPQPVKFDIQGMKIGDKLEPQWAFSRMDSHEAFKPEARGLEEIDVDGKKVRVHYQFAEHRLIQVSLSFDASSFETVVKAYTAKFGVPPHLLMSEPLKNRMGAQFQNVIATWYTTDGLFVVEKYGMDLNTGLAEIKTKEARAFWSSKAKADEQELRSRL